MSTLKPILLFAQLCLACNAIAHEFKAGELFIDHPWAMPPPPGATSIAGYFSVINNGEEDEQLLSATTELAAGVELHETRIVDDIARMRRLNEGLVIPSGESVVLQPGGIHMMLVSPEIVLQEGDTIKVTLSFKRAGLVDVVFQLEMPDLQDQNMMGAADHAAH